MKADSRHWHKQCFDVRVEVHMSPFIAALIAAGYMASVFAVFGLGPRFTHRAH